MVGGQRAVATSPPPAAKLLLRAALRGLRAVRLGGPALRSFGLNVGAIPGLPMETDAVGVDRSRCCPRSPSASTSSTPPRLSP